MKILALIKNPFKIFCVLAYRLYLFKGSCFKCISDKMYLKLFFRGQMGKKLDIKHPVTFNEKMQWLKLYDRKPLYTQLVDKYEVKKYVANKIGEEFVISTYGIYSSFDDIDFTALPDKFVIKCTHDSGGLVICDDKKKINIKQTKKKINSSFSRNYYYLGREWPYLNIKPRIIIEEYIDCQTDSGLFDYKFYCFNGIPKLCLVCANRYKSGGLVKCFYDMSWNKMNIARTKEPVYNVEIEKPSNFDEMVVIAKKLSKNFIFLRVDLYNVKGRILFGELTFYPSSGFEGFNPNVWDKKLGSWIELDDII